MAEERTRCEVLGRDIGSYTGWDQPDTFTIQFIEFEPREGVNIPAGTLYIEFETGAYEVFDSKGDSVASGDIVNAIKDIKPPEPTSIRHNDDAN
jgi:hypothetical protein